MRLLIDSNIFLAHFGDAKRLGVDIRNALDEADQVYLSTASAWEIGIKYSRGALEFELPLEAAIEHGMRQYRLTALDVTQRHTFMAASLPYHHKDPFGRMLVAQAISERLTLVTTDRALKRYEVPILGV